MSERKNYCYQSRFLHQGELLIFEVVALHPRQGQEIQLPSSWHFRSAYANTSKYPTCLPFLTHHTDLLPRGKLGLLVFPSQKVLPSNQPHSPFRLMTRFYSAAKASKASFGDDGYVSRLPLRETFPVFVFWVCAAAPLMLTSSGRYLYTRIAVVGSVLGIVWMSVRR